MLCTLQLLKKKETKNVNCFLNNDFTKFKFYFHNHLKYYRSNNINNELRLYINFYNYIYNKLLSISIELITL